ncbi:hypothetical protein [Gimesia algae]|nr:hypothetical protein [Gimesia algae]
MFVSETIAVNRLKELFEKDHLKPIGLEQSLKDFSREDIFKALRHYELANAHDLKPVEFRGASHVTALAAVFEVGKFIANEVLGHIQLLSAYWKQEETSEELVRHNITQIQAIAKIAAMVDDPLLRRLLSQMEMESIRAERWLYDVYGYDGYESAEPDTNQTEYTVDNGRFITSTTIRKTVRELRQLDPDNPGYSWFHSKKKGWPDPSIKHGEGNPDVWRLEDILDHLTQTFSDVDKQTWINLSESLPEIVENDSDCTETDDE